MAEARMTAQETMERVYALLCARNWLDFDHPERMLKLDKLTIDDREACKDAEIQELVMLDFSFKEDADDDKYIVYLTTKGIIRLKQIHLARKIEGNPGVYRGTSSNFARRVRT